ncbi:DUF2207 domain-containing protein [Microbacterium sp. 179-I 3D3 NHS]|uniref:DUF2207 domain-containing protein n=1 Tax=Microbacterium sp. 179-I 3D3 NHS TaxID=3142382 RepID=UPI00399F1E6A
MNDARRHRPLAAVLLALAAIVLPTGAVIALPAGADAATSAAPASASVLAGLHADGDVDDFSYASWDAVYEVGLDDDGRARMHVTETLVARFPDDDQNRGIVRGLPTSYQNAGIDTRIVSVTDEDGAAVPYETDEEDGLLFVLTGTDAYVRGLTTYVIEYEMRDVILPADSSTASGTREGARESDDRRPPADEFFWDLLPFDSTQPIERFRADIVFDAAMSDRLIGSKRCYTGFSGSTAECDIAGPSVTDGIAAFRVESGERAAGDGVTIAIGFEPGTAVQPSARTPNPVTDTVPLVAAIGAATLSVGAWVGVWSFQRRRRTASGIVIAQYDVPDAMPPLLAAAIVPGARDAIPAEIVHLAVRGALRIEEGSTPESPRLRRLAEPRALDPLDTETLDALFVASDAAESVDIPSESADFAERMGSLGQSGVAAAAARGLTARARSRTAIVLQWCAIAIAVVGLTLSVWGVASGRISAVPALAAVSFGAVLVLVASFFSFARHTVLTPDGARELERLRGVEEFIRIADADRLRMLQSYSGAERRPDGDVDVIHVYERLLPYAMLFGLEREWGDVLEQAYAREQSGPAWIGDPTSPHLGIALAGFTASSHAAATYTAPTAGTSSSAGGSFGGGFAGGGGGGGFSGGR